MISSIRHSDIQHLRRLLGRRSARLEAGAFVVEGPTLVAEALASTCEVRAVYLSPDGDDPHGLERSGAVHRCDAAMLGRVLSTVTPRPEAAVVVLPEVDIAEVAESDDIVVVLDAVADPGNVGTIVRAAEAAGAGGIVAAGGSADPFGPKAVRAAAGSSLRLPVLADSRRAGDVIVRDMGGRRTLGAVSGSGRSHLDVDWSGRVTLVVGNEAHGLDAETTDACDELVTVELAGPTESLNVAMATTVLLFEALRATRE